MTRTLQIALALLLVLPGLPAATALHSVPPIDDPSPTPAPHPDDVGIIQVDQKKDGLVDDANALANRSAPLFGDVADARDQGEQALPAGLVELFSDGIEGDRHGAFGPWQVVGTPAWDEGIAPGGHVLTSGILEKGHYTAGARSFLVTPEIDLRTGAEIVRDDDAKIATLEQTLEAYMEALGVAETVPDTQDAMDGVDEALDQLPPQAAPVGNQVRSAKTTAEGARATAETTGGSPSLVKPSTSTVYNAIYYELANLLYGECLVAQKEGCTVQSIPVGYAISPDAAEPSETAITFTFDRRFNLAEARDGVQVYVFSAAPTELDLAGCGSRQENVKDTYERSNAQMIPVGAAGAVGGTPPCAKVQTVDRYGAPTRAFGSDPGLPGNDEAYTGYSPWVTEAIDLTSWAGESVWVAFLFASENAVGDAYFGSSRLNQTAGFYGFQLDNVSVTSPAPQTSLRVRPFSEPAWKPDEGGRVTLALDSKDNRLVTDVGNMGTNPMEFELRLHLYERDDHATQAALALRNGTVEFTEPGNMTAGFAASLGVVTLEPGRVHHVAYVLPDSLTAHNGSYELVLEAVPTQPDATRPEAYPADDVHRMALDVRNVVRPPTVGTISRSASSINSEETIRFDVPITNGGNVPLPVDATAQVIDVATGQAVTNAVTFEENRMSGVVPPGGDLTLSWNATGNFPGQYRFFVRINNETPYSKEQDLQPPADVLQSQWVDAAKAPVLVDGQVSKGEWNGLSNHVREFRDPYGSNADDSGATYRPKAATADKGQSLGNVRVMNNESQVWISVSVPKVDPWYTSPRPNDLAILFDDGADGLEPGADHGVLTSLSSLPTTPGPSVPAVDLSFQEAHTVGVGDDRLSGRFPGIVDASSPDRGFTLRDDERLSPYVNAPAGILDLDASRLVNAGDFDVEGGLRRASAVWDGGRYSYVFGGSGPSGLLDSILRFDNVTGHTETVGQLPSAREGTSAVWDGVSAYVFGGRDRDGPLGQIVKFTPGAGAAPPTIAVLTASLPAPRTETAAAFDAATKTAYIFGGRTASSAHAQVFRFSTETTATAIDGLLPTPLAAAGAASAGSRIYVFGGDRPNLQGVESASDDILLYTPDSSATPASAGSAAEVATFGGFKGRSATSAVWNGTVIHVFGGRNGTALLDDILAFTPGPGATLADSGQRLPSARQAMAAAGGEGQAYLFGGSTSTGYVNRAIRHWHLMVGTAETALVPRGAFLDASDFRAGTGQGLEPLPAIGARLTAMGLFSPVLRFNDTDDDGRFSAGDKLYRQAQALPWRPEACMGTLALTDIPDGATSVVVQFPASGVPDHMRLLASSGFDAEAQQVGGAGGAITGTETISDTNLALGPTFSLSFNATGTLLGGTVQYGFPAGEPQSVSPVHCIEPSSIGSQWEVASVASATNITYEFSGPLGSSPGGLQAGPGDALRAIVLRQHLRYPAAAVVDGEGLVPADGDLDDEAANWATIRLATPPGAPTPVRRMGPGFGVERVPPPLLEVTMQDCAGLAGWTQTSILDGVGPVTDARMVVAADPLAQTVDKWNCAPYGPDGRLRLYEGLSPDAWCGNGHCPQWSGIEGASADFALSGADPWDEELNPNDLITPPFTIGDVATPYLTLRHQYATDVAVNDDLLDIGLMGVARVFVQERVGGEHNGTWRAPVLVNPVGDYSTEKSHPSLNNGAVHRKLTSPLGSPFYEESADPCPKEPNDGIIGLEIDPPCGWWAPTGFQPRFRPDLEEIAIGGIFSGSDWTVDRLKLYGYGHGFAEDQTLELQGRTVRLIFEFYQSGAKATDPRADRDLGWRIEGLAVTEGPDFSRDLVVTDVSLVPQLYDPAKLGLGPATVALVNVTVANRGLLAANTVSVCLHAVDVSSVIPLPAGCPASAPKVDFLASGESKTLTFPYKVPAEDPSGKKIRLAFLARALAPTGDDFPADNELRMQESFDVRASPDAAIVVDATPLTDQAGRARELTVRVVNRGNVNITDATVMRTILRVDGDQAGAPALGPDTWTLKTLPVGSEVSLAGSATTTPVTTQHLTFKAPGKSGTFAFLGEVTVAGDTEPLDNSDLVTIRAVDLRYGNNFDGPSPLKGLVLPPEWSLQQSAVNGTMLVAGQGGDGLPLNADTSVELPIDKLDLRSARDAVLTFAHHYELEEGYDAARVEVSTDGGLTWRPLRPVPRLDTPSGYPDLALTGTNPLLGGQSSATAIAFTGSSANVPGADEAGWLLSEFNLGDDPGLARPGGFESFRLDDLPAYASQTIQTDDGQLQFTNDPQWMVKTPDGDDPEPGARVRQRYWWIQNISLEEPQPHAGSSKMWWSGSTGNPTYQPVHDVLERQLVLPSGTTVDPGTQVFATWWEWRAGAADGGTGGWFNASLVDHAKEPILLQTEDSGWRQWAFDVTDLAEQPQLLALRFEYSSIPATDFLDPLLANNGGWFLDDFGLQAFTTDVAGVRRGPQDLLVLETLETLDASAGMPPGWATRKLDGHSAEKPQAWTLVGSGVLARNGGWHVEDVVLPGLGPSKAWRFSDASTQGYPDSADSRLVTPTFDLSAAAGDVRLEFDQRYWFEAEPVCPFDGSPPGTPLTNADRARGCFLSALDGGAIEYQVLDQATASFGPWQGLYAGGAPPAVALLAEKACTNNACAADVRTVDRLRAGGDAVLAATGYNALLPRGEKLQFAPPCVTDASPAGRGTTLATAPAYAHFLFNGCDLPWRPYPVSYAFSGKSTGPDGWQRVSWDISPLAGQQVRFAFHAASNPNPAVAPDGGTNAGWTVANVAAAGNAFEGQPIRLRFRLATDGSLRDGLWAIDDISLAGTSYSRNVALVPSGTGTVEGAPGDTVALSGELANLAGSSGESANRLVLKGTAVRAGETEPFDDNLFDHTGEVRLLGWPTADTVPLPDGAALKIPPLDPGDRVPLEFTVSLPDDAADVELHFTVLRNFGDATPDYRPFIGERAGTTQAVWHAKAVERDAVDFVSVVPGRAGRLAADPPSGVPDKPVHLTVGIENRGTTAPDAEATWEVHLVSHKGDAQRLGQGAEESEIVFKPGAEDLGTLQRCTTQACDGERVQVSTDFTPDEPGLYRATLLLNGGDLAADSLEFLVLGPGTATNYYDVDFALPGLQDWADNGVSPASLAFRRDGDALRWGVTPTQYQEMTYCTAPGAQCVFPTGTNPGGTSAVEMYSVKGLEGIAIGPPVALDRVPQGQAFLNLRHGLDLEAGDGARVELLPLRYSPDGEPGAAVWKCADGSPLSFILVPEPASAYGAIVQSLPGYVLERAGVGGTNFGPETIPNQINVLAPGLDPGSDKTAFGGARPVATTRFRLDEPATSACNERQSGAPLTLPLMNYTVQPILHVGTLPGYEVTRPGVPDARRAGALGWAVHRLSISSSALSVEPLAANYTILGGAPKEFFMTVRNDGQLQDQVRLEVDTAGSTLPSPAWIVLPTEPIVLAPGEARRVKVGVAPPPGEDLAPGSYAAPVLLRSLVDDTMTALLDATVIVPDREFADLVGILDSDLELGEPFRVDTIAPIHVTVMNIGSRPSAPVEAILEVVGPDGTSHLVGKAAIPDLCPRGRQGCPLAQGQKTFTSEWTVPPQPGDYQLRLLIDAGGRILEASKANNIKVLAAPVAPQALADLELTRLDIMGLDASGVAQHGDVLTFAATVTNVGTIASAPFSLEIFLMKDTMADKALPGLAPGKSAVVEVTGRVEREHTSATARVIVGGFDGNIGNDEAQRALRVLGSDLVLRPSPGNVSIAPGGTADLRVEVENRGNVVEVVLLKLDPLAQGWGLVADPNPVALAPGDVVSVALHLVAPANAPAGPATLRLQGVPNGGGRGLGEAPLNVTVEPRPGTPLVEPLAGSGAPGAATLSVRLTSTSNVPQDLSVRLTSPEWVSKPVNVTLPASGSTTVKLPLEVPKDAAVGAHDLTVVVARRAGPDLATAKAPFEVEPGPALSASWSGAARTGGPELGLRTVDFDLKVRNSGNVPLRPSVSLRDLGPGLTGTGQAAGEPLAPGEDAVLTVQVRLAADAQEHLLGHADLWAVLDDGAEMLAATLTIPSATAAPDLRIASAIASPRIGVKAGDTVRIQVVVENHGEVEAPGSILFASANGFLVDPVDVPAVPAGGSVPINVTMTFTKGGTYVLSFLADGGSSVAEVDDGDNGLTLDVEVAKPGLADQVVGIPAPSLGLLALALLGAVLTRRRRRGGQ